MSPHLFSYLDHQFLFHIVASSTVGNLQVTTPTATTLTITWTVSGFIDRFEVVYSYTVNGCSATGGPLADTISDGSMRSYTLRNLNEDSSYTITVRAFNTVGSAMAMTTGSTSTAGNWNTLNDIIFKFTLQLSLSEESKKRCRIDAPQLHGPW